MKTQYLKDLKDKDSVSCFFLAKSKNRNIGKNGKAYIALRLSDKTGTIDARVWDNVDQLDLVFGSGDIIKVKGVIQTYQEKLQIVVHRIEKNDQEFIEIEEFIGSSQKDSEVTYHKLINVVKNLTNPHIQSLCLSVLTDPEIKEKIMVCPAAKTIHHAYIGGLLDHILSICHIMNFLGNHYEELDENLLVFGAIFHDICKIWEFDVENGIKYTDIGRLVGHLVLGSELVEKKASQILGFPEDLKNICKHIVLSHHGRYEYGSPKRPKSLEALVVAMIDDLDSKIDSIGTLLKNTKDTWTPYSSLYDRYFYNKKFNQPESPDV